MLRQTLTGLLACTTIAPASLAEVPPARFEAFLDQHCIACHGPEEDEGDLRIDLLSRDFSSNLDTHLWHEVIDRINSGEMPPRRQPKPPQEDIAAFVQKLDSLMKEGAAARLAARPPVSHYRLSRREYQNTVYDLLGVRYDPTQPGELNEDSLWHGYERIGSQLSLSPSHVDRYYRAAETVIGRAFPDTPAAANTVRKTAVELRYGGGESQREALERFGITRPLRYLLFPGRIQTALSPGWLGEGGPARSGLYKVRIQASGIRTKGGRPPHLSIGTATGASNDAVIGIIELDITAPEDSPEIYEFEVLLEMPTTLNFCVVANEWVDDRAGGAFRGALTSRDGYLFTHTSEPLPLNPNAPQMFDGEGNGLFSTVLLDWIEWEGPVETGQERSRRAGVLPPEAAATEVVAAHLHRFAERAWRRPVDPLELENYLGSYKAELAAGETMAEAYRLALQGVLTSRNFLYLVEGDPEPRPLLTGWELASRLSYFLWSSMPDEALLSAARDGTLDGDGLGGQVDRLLADPKIERFIEDFSRQWLQLHSLGMFPPDRNLYPSYDAWLETSLRREPIAFFREMLAQNAPIESFLDSDWTMANARLAEFYGLPATGSGEFERVSLKPEDNRGGLMAMGAVLGLTSDGTRHRPVHRGVWVSETIFNRTPPAPPADVEPIEPTPPDSPKVTIREKLQLHAKDANCAACHQNIDPLGFAWDQYDAIGQWRTQERDDSGQGDHPPVDASGVLPDGREFADAREFRQLLLQDRDRFARAFIEHLCTYGLRRVLTFDDQDDIQAIAEEAKEKGYGLKDVVRAVAASELMRKR